MIFKGSNSSTYQTINLQESTTPILMKNAILGDSHSSFLPKSLFQCQYRSFLLSPIVFYPQANYECIPRTIALVLNFDLRLNVDVALLVLGYALQSFDNPLKKKIKTQCAQVFSKHEGTNFTKYNFTSAGLKEYSEFYISCLLVCMLKNTRKNT